MSRGGAGRGNHAAKVRPHLDNVRAAVDGGAAAGAADLNVPFFARRKRGRSENGHPGRRTAVSRPSVQIPTFSNPRYGMVSSVPAPVPAACYTRAVYSSFKPSDSFSDAA